MRMVASRGGGAHQQAAVIATGKRQCFLVGKPAIGRKVAHDCLDHRVDLNNGARPHCCAAVRRLAGSRPARKTWVRVVVRSDRNAARSSGLSISRPSSGEKKIEGKMPAA